MKGDTTGQGVVPLRTILRNILNLIDSFETRYKEGLDSYDQEFQELKQFSENLKTDPGYLCKEGEKSVNRKKNRYKDILPFDYTRVILTDYGDVPGSDYINANFIKGASGSSAYIACQGPLPHTVNDFWRMVVECEVQVIVMACNEQESGKHKCENYWVEEEGVEREFGSVTIWLKKSRQVCPDFLVRTMKIRYPNSKGDMEERSVCQFHYSAWPDHGVPLKVRPLLDMVRLIRDCQTSETLPVLVHCSAGCGRTGTICAIDYVWGLLRLGKLTPDFSLFNLVRDMRRQRIAMVQTKDQYILVHRAVRELFEEQLKIIDSHPYANVDINGLPIDLKADLEEPVYETVQFVSSVPRLREDTVDAHRKDLPNHPPPPSPPSNPVSNSVHEKFEESYDNRPEEKARIIKVSGGSNSSSSSSSGSKKVNNVTCTPSPPSGSHGEVSVIESRSTSDHELENSKRGPSSSKPESSSSSSKQGSAKSSLLRNPSIVKLKAFFEKSKDDKEKKVFPGLSRAKSDVSSSSRFYTNLASTFTSRANRNAPSEIKSSEITPPPPKAREKTPVEKIKSKPALLSKPNISVKRSKSLKIVRPIDNSRENVNLISSVNIGSDMPDGPSVNLRAPSSSQHVSPDSHSIKVNVHHVEMPKLQKPVSKSVKPESFKATTSHERDKRAGTETLDNFSKRVELEYHEKVQPPKKPDVPSKSHLLDKVFIPSSTDLYGTTRIKIGISLDDSAKEHKGNHSKMNGKIKKYGTVNSKMVSAGGGGTLLTRSQSHVWQPSKPQVPVRIFSDENLSQVGSVENGTKVPTDEPSNKKSFDEPESVRIHRKQSLPITKTTSSSKVKSLAVPTYESMDFKSQEEQQPRSLTLTSHSSFLEARKRVPKTNPYANYSPSANEARNYKDLPSSGKGNQEKGGSSPLTQFHFGENIPLLKNGGNNSLLRNSSESSSNPGTPRNSLPGTPTQSTDVLYSPVSVNTSSGNYNSSGRNQSKSFLKGSLSSTPSESDERLDVTTRNPFSSSMAQSQVTTNITGPQKISSVRTGVGVRERRNSFRQAVWKEDQRAPPNKEEDKSENIYITTTSSVPYFVKSSAMPVHHNAPLPGSMSSSYITPATSAMTTSISNNVSTTTALERTHRDYEPIWPDPGSSTNPFKIGIAEKRTTHLESHNALMDKSHRLPSSNSSASLGEDKLPTLKSESQVQDRMAEIKVLLEELKAPGKIEGQMQRMNVQMDSRTSQIPTRKINEKQSQSFLDKPQTTGDSRPAAGSGLRYHRSLRAPSRPQYQQGFACFTFKKPSSFESITDQVYAEELMSTKTHGKEDAHSSNDMGGFQEDPFQQSEKSHLQNQRLNDYVSLRNCKTASVSHNNRDGRSNEPTSSQNHHPLHHQALSKSESTPVPPPRSKRGGGVRRELGNYVNVLPDHQMFSNSNHGWTSKESTTTNGFHDNHSFSNGTTMAIRKDSSPDEEELSRSYQANGQDYSRISSAGSIPLLNNSSNNNASSTSPKAIIRALGLFQAKAANVRSRLANWSENKERPGTKRTN